MFIDYTRALVRARELDDHFCKTGGGTVGPLHGLPVSLKVLNSAVSVEIAPYLTR